MHIFRNFSLNLFKPARLVFDTAKGPEKEPNTGKSIKEPDKEAGTLKPAEGARPETAPPIPEKRPSLPSAEEQLEVLALSMNKEGEPSDYIETFKRGGDKFEHLVAYLETIMPKGNKPGEVPPYESWTNMNPEDVAAMFNGWPEYFPNGRGKNAFIDGMKIGPRRTGDTSPEAIAQEKKYGPSRRALEGIVRHLREYFALKRGSKLDIEKQANKPVVGETIGDGMKTLMKNFNRSSGMEKGLILAGIGLGIYLLHKHKDDKLLFGATLGSTATVVGGLFLANYMSGKVSKDGRTLLQRLDFFRDVDDLSDNNVLKAYALSHGMGENQEKLRALYEMQSMDIKRLFQLYVEAKRNTMGTGEIDVKRLGKHKGEADGKALFEIMDDLVAETSINEHRKARRARAQLEGKPYSEPSDDEIRTWTQSEKSIQAFGDKYINPESSFGRADLKLFDVVVNEYAVAGTNEALWQGKPVDAFWRGEIERRKKARLTDRTAAETKRLAVAVGGYAVEKGKALGSWMYDTGKEVLSFTERNTRSLRAWAGDKVKEGLAYLQEKNIKEVLGTDFDVDVTKAHGDSKTIGKATIMGVPGVEFEMFPRAADNTDVAVINGVTFLLGTHPENKPLADQLKQALANKVEKMVAAANVPQLKGIKPEWNATAKKWELPKVPVAASADLSVPAGDITLTLKMDPDGKIRFMDDKKEIMDFSKSAETHRDSEIQKAVFKEASPDLQKYGHIDALPVTDIKVAADKTITGKLAGLEFTAKPRDGATLGSGLVFVDAGGNKGGFEKVEIKETNCGPIFLEAVSQEVMKTGEFQNSFFKLQYLLDNTSEGFLTRIDKLFPDRMYSVIPAGGVDIPASVNGQILQRQWQHMLDFKRQETLSLFKERALDKGNVASIPDAYKEIVQRNTLELEKLYRDIDKEDDQKRADKFKDYMMALENVNYPNPDYQKLFTEFVAMISKFDYEGFESFGDVGTEKWAAGDKAYGTQNVLYSVFSFHTQEFMAGTSISPADQDKIRLGVTEKMKQALEEAKAKGGGTVHLADLPKTDGAHIDSWVDPARVPAGRRLWSAPHLS
ncbi:hypothetical protein HZA42_00450 [Candidatus Peregrinibacteria bacterium]|nr:hypothetical protein [Candidatus Peregrinibacteria bacterium]